MLRVQRDGLAPSLALVLLLVGALVIRVLPVGSYFPYSYYVDEGHLIGRAARMLQSGDTDPHWFAWPTFLIYLHAAVFWLATVLAAPLLERGDCAGLESFYWPAAGGQLYNVICPADMLIVGRIVTALFGAGTILLVFLLVRRLNDVAAALSAAAILAFLPGHVEFSRNVTGDVPMTFFAVAALRCSILILEGGGRRDHIWAGVFVGLAVASKYTAGLLLLLPATALILRGRLTWGEVRRYLWVPLVAGGLFFVLDPYHLLQPATAYKTFLSEITYYQQDRFASLATRNPHEWLDNFLAADRVGAAVVAAALVGLGLAWWRGERRLLVPVPFVVAFSIPLVAAPMQPFRNFLPVVAMLAIWAGYGIAASASLALTPRLLRWTPLLVVLLTGACLAPSVGALLRQTRDALQVVNSRRQVIDWLIEHPQGGNAIVIDAKLQLHPSELRRLSAQGARFRVMLTQPKPTAPPTWYVAARLEGCRPGLADECAARDRFLDGLDSIATFGAGRVPNQLDSWVGKEPRIGVYLLGGAAAAGR